MEAAQARIPLAAELPHSPGRQSDSAFTSLYTHRRATPKIGDSLALGLARLIDGQRQFAEEFGLPYGRVFSGGFEEFKNQDAGVVIKRWFGDPEAGAERLQILFDDLIAHQLAIIAGVDGAVLHALNSDFDSSADALRRLPLWARAVRAVLPGRIPAPVESDHTLRYLYLVAPAFVAAYARAREQFAGQTPRPPDKRKAGLGEA